MRGYTQTSAIILSAKPHREKDRRVELLSPDLGKISAIARGARNIKSHFVSRLQPLNVCSILLYKNSTGYWTIIECVLEKNFKKLNKNLKKIQEAFRMIESLKNIEETGKYEILFELLGESLEKLENSEAGEKNALIFQTFRVKLLDILGLLPAFTHCVHCDQKIDYHPEQFWNPSEITCSLCQENKSRKGYKDVYRKLVHYLKTKNFSQILKLRLNQKDEKALWEITENLWIGAGNLKLKASEIHLSLHD